MSYIGKAPGEHFTSFQTETFSVSVTTSYTLSYAVANENELALFINNVRQQPGSGKAYTASGTALTLSAATASTDTMYAIYLGRALQTITPSTNSITSGMLGSAFFTGATDVGAAIADADLFLMDDGAGGTLRKTAASRIKTYVGSGLAEADNWRITADTTTNGFITSNWERNDANDFAVLGTGMTESSGVFSFPSTGKYLINAHGDHTVNDNTSSFNIYTTVDNSTYTFRTSGATQTTVTRNLTTDCWYIMNVTNTSNDKVKFQTSGYSDGNQKLRGNTAQDETHVTFIKIA